jgi:hypothetical protein
MNRMREVAASTEWRGPADGDGYGCFITCWYRLTLLTTLGLVLGSYHCPNRLQSHSSLCLIMVKIKGVGVTGRFGRGQFLDIG